MPDPKLDVQIENAVDHVLRENPNSVQLYQAGHDRMFTVLMGKIMKHTKGNSSILPMAKQILEQKLNQK